MTGTTGADHGEPRTVTTIEELRAAVAHARPAGRKIGFVPTMGALHEGHVSLMHAAKKAGSYVVVSIYVNPTQFGPKEDFRQYPRTMETDRAACAKAGVDLIFAPTDAEVYPPGDQTRVRPGKLGESLCGACRPGHFEGVCTVVAKLFNIVQPDVAYFGQKDAQQAVILRRMVKDLCMPVRIEICPLIREPDGLAMSSRNVRLSPEERQQALSLYRALCLGRDRLSAGEGSVGRITAEMRSSIVQNGAGVSVDYLSIVDPETLEPVTESNGRVIIAGCQAHRLEAGATVTETHRLEAGATVTETHRLEAGATVTEAHRLEAGATVTETHRLEAGATVTETHRLEAGATVMGPRGQVMIAGAIRVGATRLIDNVLVDVPRDQT